jgi:hypothetical protein
MPWSAHRPAADVLRVSELLLTKIARFPAIKTLEQYVLGFTTGAPK